MAFDAATIAIPVGKNPLVWYGITGSSASTFNNVDPNGRIRSVVDSVDVIVIFFSSRVVVGDIILSVFSGQEKGVRPIEI